MRRILPYIHFNNSNHPNRHRFYQDKKDCEWFHQNDFNSKLCFQTILAYSELESLQYHKSKSQLYSGSYTHYKEEYIDEEHPEETCRYETVRTASFCPAPADNSTDPWDFTKNTCSAFGFGLFKRYNLERPKCWFNAKVADINAFQSYGVRITGVYKDYLTFEFLNIYKKNFFWDINIKIGSRVYKRSDFEVIKDYRNSKMQFIIDYSHLPTSYKMSVWIEVKLQNIHLPKSYQNKSWVETNKDYSL